jgi:hypothetical protein
MSGNIREQGTVIGALGAKGVGRKRIAARDGGWSSLADALFQAATVPSRTVGRKALTELISAGRIQQIGGELKGKSLPVFLLWARRRP